MNTKIPEALAVLDKAARMLDRAVELGGNPVIRNQRYECAEQICKASAAFAAEHEALKWARNELASLPRSLGYDITHLPEIDSALAAVEVLPK